MTRHKAMASTSRSQNGGAKQSTLRPPVDEIEAGDLAGEHGGVAPVPGQGEPHPQRHPGHRWAQAGRQHDGVPQRPLAQQDDADSFGLGPDGLGPQPLHVVCQEEPSFHAVAD